MIFLISGPSGVGKSFLCKNIIKHLDHFYLPKKHTTRKRRLGEDDFEYFFTSIEDFQAKRQEELFVADTEIYGNFYGLPFSEIEAAYSDHKHAIFILDAFLAQEFKKKLPQTTLIFILPADISELVAHLTAREKIYNERVDERLQLLSSELEQHINFDYVIPHYNGESSLEILKGIIISKFCQNGNFGEVNRKMIKFNHKIYPKLAVDAVIFDTKKEKIILVERLKEPRGWALPGGFIENEENIEEALIREVLEETGVTLSYYNDIGIFSDPDRDPRLRVISIAFVSQTACQIQAGGDAKTAKWFSIQELPENLLFDHDKIIAKAITAQLV